MGTYDLVNDKIELIEAYKNQTNLHLFVYLSTFVSHRGASTPTGFLWSAEVVRVYKAKKAEIYYYYISIKPYEIENNAINSQVLSRYIGPT